MARKTKERVGEHMLDPKKEFILIADKVYPTMYKIGFDDGGVIPKALKGLYNSKKNGHKAIAQYEKDNDTYLKHVRDKEYAKDKQDKDRK